MASRPWRDGQDVLKVAMRHLPDVFVVTPSGSLLAPDVVELQLNPADLDSLCERMELGVISSSLTEVYEEQVAAYRARLGRAGPGRGVRHRQRFGPAGPLPAAAGRSGRAGPGPTWPMSRMRTPRRARARRAAACLRRARQPRLAGPGPTRARRPQRHDHVMEQSLPAVPALRLVTGSSVAETRMSGARAGRGPVELMLPDVPTVSREHARFTFADGRWWITNQGRNGLTLNGAPVTGEQPLSDGDAIRWGTNPDAPLSRVEIS